MNNQHTDTNVVLLNNMMIRLKNLWLFRSTQNDYQEYCYKFRKIMDVLDENDLSISRRLEDFLFDAGLPPGTNPSFYRNRIIDTSFKESIAVKHVREENLNSSTNELQHNTIELKNIEKPAKIKKVEYTELTELKKVDFIEYHISNCHASIEALKVKAKRDHFEVENVRECKNCTKHKMMLDFLAKLEVPKTTSQRKQEKFHCFLSPDFPQIGFTGAKNYLIVVDNYSKMMFIYTLKDRRETTRILIKFMVHCFSRFGYGSIRTVITPDLNELRNELFFDFMQKHHIRHTIMEQDDFVNYYARSVQVMIKLIMNDAEGIDESLWSEGIKAAVFVYNNIPNASLNWKCPTDIWRDKLLVVPEKFYPFGKWMMARFADSSGHKSKIYRCRLVGYHPHDTHSYRFYNPKEELIGFARISDELSDNNMDSNDHSKDSN